MSHINACVDPGRGGGGAGAGAGAGDADHFPPPFVKNHGSIGFLSNTGPEPLENHKATTQQTCLYGSHMGYPYGTHMGSATGFLMGPIWVSPYAGCPDGSHMGPI